MTRRLAPKRITIYEDELTNQYSKCYATQAEQTRYEQMAMRNGQMVIARGSIRLKL